MRRASGVALAAASLVLLWTMQASAEHIGTGMVLSKNPDRTALRLVLDDGERVTLFLDKTVTAVDDFGHAIPADSLQQGDRVREICTRMPDGRLVATRLTLLSHAWRGLASPEW